MVKLHIYTMALCALVGSGAVMSMDNEQAPATKKDSAKKASREYTPKPGSHAEEFMHNFVQQNPAWRWAMKTSEGRAQLRSSLIRNDMWRLHFG